MPIDSTKTLIYAILHSGPTICIMRAGLLFCHTQRLCTNKQLRSSCGKVGQMMLFLLCRELTKTGSHLWWLAGAWRLASNRPLISIFLLEYIDESFLYFAGPIFCQVRVYYVYMGVYTRKVCRCLRKLPLPHNRAFLYGARLANTRIIIA